MSRGAECALGGEVEQIASHLAQAHHLLEHLLHGLLAVITQRGALALPVELEQAADGGERISNFMRGHRRETLQGLREGGLRGGGSPAGLEAQPPEGHEEQGERGHDAGDERGGARPFDAAGGFGEATAGLDHQHAMLRQREVADREGQTTDLVVE